LELFSAVPTTIVRAHSRRGKAASSIDTAEGKLGRSSAGLTLILG
jgi:hypothetical protein